MTVDLDAIAQRGHCEVSSLRLALPLIEQGYTPPFLSRYRRDELGGIDEAALWTLARAVRADQALADYRHQLHTAWETTPLADPSIKKAIQNAGSRRLLDRLNRRIKQEASESPGWLQRFAVRTLNPHKGDGVDLHALAELVRAEEADPSVSVDTVTETTPSVADESAPPNDSAATATLSDEKMDIAIAKRLCGDPRIIGAAVRWLSRHAKIHVLKVHDPHVTQDSDRGSSSDADEDARADQTVPEPADETASSEQPAAESDVPSAAADEDQPLAPLVESLPSESELQSESPVAEDPTSDSESPTDSDETPADATETDSAPAAAPLSETASDSASNTATADLTNESTVAKPTKAKGKSKAKAKKAAKKISPRQRRRRWLVGTLKPLAGKKVASSKLSSFQIVMLGRALRSQVATCAFDYDPARLVSELQKTAANMNRPLGDRLSAIVMQHESAIRDAAEAAWWEELQEQASAKLVSIAADHLHGQINRGGVDAKVVMSIDAVGPRTAATAIVAADGRLIHCEDIPCQLSASLRAVAVTKMGELIHQYGVDLIVISNGPARRACMIATGELINQSTESSIRWTLADRNGADAYAGSPAGDLEMRATPRRFRAASWIAFAALQPSQALVKVDPLKLRLGSFQRELSDDAILAALEDVLVSGASRGGVDVNSAASSWLRRLPGMSQTVAEAIDQRRQSKLFGSRKELLDDMAWESVVHSRQALPFLRVFESDETLDGTLIHPDDYALARKLASALEVELPPSCPPGYQLPDYSEPPPAQPDVSEATKPEPEQLVVQEISPAEPAADSFEGLPSPPDETSIEASKTEPGEVTDDGVSDTTIVEERAASPSDEADTHATAASDSTDEAADAGPKATAESSIPADGSSTDESTSEIIEPEATAETVAVAEAVRRTRPEQAKVDKLIKEWQVGRNRGQQIVDWLCDPFGDGAVASEPPAVMTSMPTLTNLHPGEPVIGVVVGVMPFGVFVELSPECSGLIHVSKISDGFVEDLHEAVQVGDVVTAYITGIDSKRRRVALSAISPERESQLKQQRQSRGPAGGGRSRGGSKQRGGGPSRRGQGQSNAEAQRGGSKPRSGSQGQRSGAPSAGGGQRGGKPGGQKSSQGGGGQRRDGGRGGRHGGQRRDSSRGSRGRKPEVYEVVGKDIDSSSLTDAMAKGDEPMRSFGDLMQLFKAEKGGSKPESSGPPPEAPTPNPATPDPSADQHGPDTESPLQAPDPVSPASGEIVRTDQPGNQLEPNAVEPSPETKVASEDPNA
ncbi:MAG: S1 RNA-binding domain-containing protein [Planctomycetota bacterium]